MLRHIKCTRIPLPLTCTKIHPFHSFRKERTLSCYFKIIRSTVITQIVFLCVTVFPLSEIHLPLKSPLHAFIFCSEFLSFSPSCRNFFIFLVALSKIIFCIVPLGNSKRYFYHASFCRSVRAANGETRSDAIVNKQVSAY